MDREQIIKDLEFCIKGNYKVTLSLSKKILALLKEQEPKPVGKEWNECPSCGKALDRIHNMHYCGVCGQAVKWNV